MTMEQPKPCPFCGGRAVLERAHRAFIGGETTRVALVRCTACSARSGRVKLSDYGATSSCGRACVKAIELWNRRVQNG